MLPSILNVFLVSIDDVVEDFMGVGGGGYSTQLLFVFFNSCITSSKNRLKLIFCGVQCVYNIFF